MRGTDDDTHQSLWRSSSDFVRSSSASHDLPVGVKGQSVGAHVFICRSQQSERASISLIPRLPWGSPSARIPPGISPRKIHRSLARRRRRRSTSPVRRSGQPQGPAAERAPTWTRAASSLASALLQTSAAAFCGRGGRHAPVKRACPLCPWMQSSREAPHPSRRLAPSRRKAQKERRFMAAPSVGAPPVTTGDSGLFVRDREPRRNPDRLAPFSAKHLSAAPHSRQYAC